MKALSRSLAGFVLALVWPSCALAQSLEANNVVWTEPSRDSSGSMPIGNGDLGLNVWVEPNGDLQGYVSKTDAWDSHARLLKLTKVRLRLTPNPFQAGLPFRQELRLREGRIEITAGEEAAAVRIKIWADALRPVVRMELESALPREVEAKIEPWRRERRELSSDEASGAETFGEKLPVVAHPDTVIQDHECCLVWYHRNPGSVFNTTLEHQDLAELVGRFPDPLLNRTFGGALTSTELARVDDTTLKSFQPMRRALLSLHALTAVTATPGEWMSRLEEQKSATERVPIEQAREAHERWWAAFWDRSWIRVLGTPDAGSAVAPLSEAEGLNRGYALQRFMNACAGRGAFPIKFNGSIFTVDVPGKFDPDYRQWGGCYWFQNTRLPYWPMLASGDLDLLPPLFRMYLDALPLARERTRLYYQHDGAFFPETMHFWGAYHNGGMGYGWERAGEPKGRTANRYIRYHWSGALELLALMLDYHAFSGGEAFLRESLLPFATDILRFYERHYPRQPNGQILFAPAQALETWWECENPMPEVAGLHFVLERLLELPAAALGVDRLAAWKKFRAELPPVPVREVEGARALLPAESWRTRQNSENPELYAIFPFRLFGVGKPDLGAVQTAFERRTVKGNRGWQQDDTQAAFLGRAQEAARMVSNRLATKHPGSRFPAFWGPNFDWIPDQDHGGNALMALQTMLLQTEGRRILLFPAWPKDWDVEFKLHAPMNTTVEGLWRQGKLERLAVQPPERERDVIRLEPQ